jgi:hypothetical protein
MSADESAGNSSPRPVKIPQLRGFLPLSCDVNPMATHGQGTLTALIRTRSTTSLQRRPSVVRNRATPDEEEAGSAARSRRLSYDGDIEDFRRSDERRLSAVLNGPPMRSQRLIGNSNPRYRWERYWKPEEELKRMPKPMCVCLWTLLAKHRLTKSNMIDESIMSAPIP